MGCTVQTEKISGKHSPECKGLISATRGSQSYFPSQSEAYNEPKKHCER